MRWGTAVTRKEAAGVAFTSRAACYRRNWCYGFEPAGAGSAPAATKASIHFVFSSANSALKLNTRFGLGRSAYKNQTRKNTLNGACKTTCMVIKTKNGFRFWGTQATKLTFRVAIVLRFGGVLGP